MAETFLGFSIETARHELRRIYVAAKASGTPLGNALAAEYARLSAVTRSGLIPSATSANAHSVSFSNVENAGISPTSLQTMWGWLLDLYDSVMASEPAPADEDEVYLRMRGQLFPARTCTNDFSLLRA